MKKHLIAAAVAAAVAAPAMAQNVTLYGALDASYSFSDAGGTGTSGKTNAMSDSVIQSSLWGLRGSEDLGGGLKAVFNIEGDINLANGQTRADTNLDNKAPSGMTADASFRRAAFLGLAGNWGELTLGRRISPTVTIGQGLSVMAGNSVSTVNQAAQGTSANFFTRQAVTYVTPAVAGFSATVQYGIAGGLATSTTAGNTLDQVSDTRGTSSAYRTTSLALNYAEGPLTAGVSQQTVNGSTGQRDHEVTNGRIHYKLGDLTIGYGAQRVNKVSAASAFVGGPNNDNTSHVYSVAYQMRSSTTIGATMVDNSKIGSLTNLQVREAVSKTTTLYAQYGLSKADSTASSVATFAPGFTLTAPAAGKDATAISVGVIKVF